MTGRRHHQKLNPKEHEPRRVALYARVAAPMQTEVGALNQQLRGMHEFARQKGWEVVAEYIDAGESGTPMDRPQLKALLQAAEEGAFDILLVYELSRLSRSVYDTFVIFAKLGQHDIGFASVREPEFDLTSSWGRLFLVIVAALETYYLAPLPEQVENRPQRTSPPS